MTTPLEELFTQVRTACSASTWSKGVELARRLAVTGVSADDAEIICRVKPDDRVVPFTVQLYPEDGEWDCTCNTPADCCQHVAAAAIAVKQARASGQTLPQGRHSDAQLIYRLTRHREFLALQRVIKKGDGEPTPLTCTLASAVATQSAGVTLSPSQQDLNVDRVLGQRIAGPLHAELGLHVIKLLEGARNVEFEGRSVYVSTEAIRPQARVTDAKQGGFLVQLQADPRVDEVLAPGIVRCGGTLHRLDATEVTGARLERLPDTRHYAGESVSTLLTQVLPELERHFVLHVETQKLPKVVRGLTPRVVLEAEQEGGTLSVLATLVYGDPPLARIDGSRLVHLGGDVPLRDTTAEQRVIQRARQQLGLVPGNRVFARGAEATQLAMRLDAYDGEVRGSLRKGFIRDQQLTPALETRGSRLSVVFGIEEGGQRSEASADAVWSAWQNGESLVPLLQGGWARLPADWLERYGSVVEQILASKEHHLGPAGLTTAAEAPQAGANGDEFTAAPGPAHVDLAWLELCRALDYPPPARLQPMKALLDGLDSLPQATLPTDLNAELRSYQRQGVNWLALMQRGGLGATLADDMGLGKTLQALCVLRGRCLVVCPTSVVYNWANELARFRPQLSFCVYHGKNRQLSNDADIVLTSYALLRLDSELLQGREWDVVVLDEAQTIKNPESQVTQAAYGLRARFRLTLTGTPVENRLDELWSQFHFTNPGLLGGRSDFQQRYAQPIAQGEPGAAALLRRKIAPFLLRRDKRTVAPELPPRTDVVLYCDLDERERELYDALYHSTRSEVVEHLKRGGGVMQALEALLRLRQAACHSALIPGQDAEDSAKVQRLLAALDQVQADGHRALVFSQWTSLLDLVEPHLQRAGVQFNRLDGSTRDRRGVVETFQRDDGPTVMLLSLKAGGTGLNLTAADHVFLLDLWWNPAVEEQAADRAHRIGQERPVFVYRLVARETVEERILELQRAKRGVAAAALADSEQAAGLSREDLLALLE